MGGYVGNPRCDWEDCSGLPMELEFKEGMERCRLLAGPASLWD